MIAAEHQAAVDKVKSAVMHLNRYSSWMDLPFEEVGEVRHGKRRWSEYVTHVLRVDGHLVGVSLDEPSTESSGEWPTPDEWDVSPVREKMTVTYEVIK